MAKAQVFIDHLTIPVRDAEASRRFYRQALAPFGVEEVELERGNGAPGLRGSGRATTRITTPRT
jgi:catechol 2,3-dioxygenase-like lactoylglutathione lyase family enzyme